MSGRVSPAAMLVAGAVGTESRGECLAPDADAPTTSRRHLVGCASAHHVHHVQRAGDLFFGVLPEVIWCLVFLGSRSRAVARWAFFRLTKNISRM